MRNVTKKLGNLAEYLVLITVIIIIWIILDMQGKLNTVIMPAPSKILNTIESLLENGTLWENLLVSVTRVLKGYALAAASGIILGIGHVKRMNCRMRF